LIFTEKHNKDELHSLFLTNLLAHRHCEEERRGNLEEDLIVRSCGKIQEHSYCNARRNNVAILKEIVFI
jgi:hypothetical protein